MINETPFVSRLVTAADRVLSKTHQVPPGAYSGEMRQNLKDLRDLISEWNRRPELWPVTVDQPTDDAGLVHIHQECNRPSGAYQTALLDAETVRANAAEEIANRRLDEISALTQANVTLMLELADMKRALDRVGDLDRAHDRKILEAMPDWSAPWEIVIRLGWENNHQNCGQIIADLERLVADGRAKYGRQNNVYRAIPTTSEEPSHG